MPKKKYNPNIPFLDYCVECGAKLTGVRRFGKDGNHCKACVMPKFICAKCGRESKYRLGPEKNLCRDCGMSEESRKRLSKVRKASESKRIQTCLDRYGVDNATKLESTQEKRRQTCLEKYGVENYTQTKEFILKSQETCLKHFGTTHQMHADEIVDKVRNTRHERYDGKYWSDEQIQKLKDTQTEKYGGVGFASPELRSKAQQTMLNRYGYTHPMQSESVKSKIRETNLAKYGKSNFVGSDMSKSRRDAAIAEFLNLPENQGHTLTSWTEMMQRYQARWAGFRQFRQMDEVHGPYGTVFFRDVDFSALDKYCDTSADHTSSAPERELYHYLLSRYPSDNPESHVLRHDRSVTHNPDTNYPLELDIYIPDNHLAIEFDGIYWHTNDLHIPLKFNQCQSQDINLIHIYEDHWYKHPDICKSLLSSALGIYDYNYSLEQIMLDTSNVSAAEAREFLSRNYLFDSTTDYSLISKYIGIREISSNKLIFVAGIIFDKDSKVIRIAFTCSEIFSKIEHAYTLLISCLVSFLDDNEKDFSSISALLDNSSEYSLLLKEYLDHGFYVSESYPPDYEYLDADLYRYDRYIMESDEIMELMVFKEYDKSLSYHENLLQNNYMLVYDSGKTELTYKIK